MEDEYRIIHMVSLFIGTGLMIALSLGSLAAGPSHATCLAGRLFPDVPKRMQ